MKPSHNRGSISQDATDTSVLTLDEMPADKIEAMFMRLTKVMTDSFNSCIAQLVDTMKNTTDVKIDAQGSEIFALARRVDALENKLESAIAEKTVATTQLTKLE